MSRSNEVDVLWRRASRSDAGGSMIEVAFVDGKYHLRDPRKGDDAVLTFSIAEFDSFAHGLRAGKFDLHGAA